MNEFSVIGDGAFARAMTSVIKARGGVLCQKAQWIIPCVPAHALSECLSNVDRTKKILIISKGMSVSDGVDMTPCDLMEHLGFDYSVLAGPHFADELVKGLYTESSLACDDDVDFRALEGYFPNVRRFKHKKILQFVGVIKNILALMSGYMDGKGCGRNEIACSIVNGIREFVFLCQNVFKEIISLDDLLAPGILGDVILTLFSSKSRNFDAGFKIAKGLFRLDVNDTIESLHSCKALMRMDILSRDQYPVLFSVLELSKQF